MLKGLRRGRHVARLQHHLKRIDTSLWMRSRDEGEGGASVPAKVLAINYELVSDATRGLDALRRVEELTPDNEIDHGMRVEFAELRQKLAELTTLPALPAWRTMSPSTQSGRATETEIATLYRQDLDTRPAE